MDATAGRSVDIELNNQEVITIDLDNLDPEPGDVIDLLRDGQPKVWVWTKVAAEYWRKGYVEAAEKIAQVAISSAHEKNDTSMLSPVYALLANIHIAHARKAPKIILPDARQDILQGQKPKEDYYREAAQFLNAGERAALDSGADIGGTLSFLTRGIQQLSTRSMDDALRSFEGVLAEKPTNVIAHLGKARIFYARRNYPQALKLFQRVLQLNPHCLPDPRIGIGLCLWAMDHKAKAKAAWQRSLEVNPSHWPAQLLLGLEAINASKQLDPRNVRSEEERTRSYLTGTKHIENAFNNNRGSAAAANALCELFLRKGNYARALKLAERTIQFADTVTVLTEGYIRAGRVCHAEGSLPQATKHFSNAKEGQPRNTMAAIGLAQMQMKNDELAAAIHTLDTLLQLQPRGQASTVQPLWSLEATVMLASLLVHPRPGVSSSDAAPEQARARELYDRVSKSLGLPDNHLSPPDINSNPQSLSRIAREIVEDINVYTEIARLWQEENLDRVGRAYKEAWRISQANGSGDDPRLLNNLGVLAQLETNFAEARKSYETALVKASGLKSETGESLATSILYNLARVYEDQGEIGLSKEAYEKLLTRHPEYVDAKIRLAYMHVNLNETNDANELLKQALSSQPSNLNLRAFYTYFLIRSNQFKLAKDFVFATLKEHGGRDMYSLCAAGWIMYHQARENRDQEPKAAEERRRGFQRSAELYEKALQCDPFCAFAAQGLAIVTAEDALGSLSGAVPLSGDETQKRFKNARDALDVFAKVRESINDGSVYLNMGHCYYARDEFDRAIESYETASTRFYDGQNVSALLCLCRSWYAKANKDQSFVAMNTALRYAQAALHISPSDKAILYNIAMIQHKAAEMLFGISPSKRSLKDLQKAIDQAAHAQKLFASLAADKAPMVPYSREIANERRKYGDSMLRRGDEHLATQRQFEAEAQAKLHATRQRRQEEKERQEELERERQIELERKAKILAEERRLAREQALEWTREVRAESDEEKERKSKRSRKPKPEGSGDEAGESKKKRRGKTKKEEQEDGQTKAKKDEQGEQSQALFSDEEDIEKPKKGRSVKKRVVRDEDDEEGTVAPRKKQFKSKELVSDTDDEME